MRYQSILALLLAQLWTAQAYASVSEVEPNSPVRGSALYQTCDPTVRVVREHTGFQTINVDPCTGTPIEPITVPRWDDQANASGILATPLSLTDEMVGQLSSPRDYDWYSVDADGSNPVTPVYFGCDKKLGYYVESPTPFTVGDPQKDVYWQIEYYYDNDPNDAVLPARQSSYVVYPDACKRGEAETKGPFRFQMNTGKPGRYYVRVWSRLVESGKDVPDQIDVQDPVTGEVSSKTRHNYYDVIVTPTADYTLRLYTARVTGELEPNDGAVEAYVLTSGQSVSGQLSSMYDQDWFAIDNDAAVNTSKRIPFFFSCKGQTGSSYFLSAYDHLGVLQVSYEIKAEQCSGAGGYSFTIGAPISARYYFVVNSPTYSDNAQFTQSDYTVLAITSTTGGTPDTPTRLPGELEPNDTQINAYPLTNDQAVTAQLSAGSDLDFYYYDNDARTNTKGVVPIYFRCGSTNAAARYQVSYFNSLGLLQKAYTVDTSQCSVPGGFRFDLIARSTARYFILVAADTGAEGSFSDEDYTISTFFNAAAEIPADVAGNMRTARIVDKKAANQDNFAFNIGQCGSRNGVVKLTGNRLNLPGVDPNTTVQVRIGPWACSATRALTLNVSNPNQTIGVYPAPPAPPAPTPKRKTGLSAR